MGHPFRQHLRYDPDDWSLWQHFLNEFGPHGYLEVSDYAAAADMDRADARDALVDFARATEHDNDYGWDDDDGEAVFPKPADFARWVIERDVEKTFAPLVDAVNVQTRQITAIDAKLAGRKVA